jgi:resuscitation-promoting factor RpfB
VRAVAVALCLLLSGCATVCWDGPAGAAETAQGGPDYLALLPAMPPPEPAVLPPVALVEVDGEWVAATLDLWAWVVVVNRCEHAHVWHNEDGRDRGFSGGLQILQSTWVGQGGREFAPTPARATINEQIVVGRRIQASGGWRQWPVCARSLA